LNILENGGIEIYQLSREEYETFKKALEPVYTKYDDIIGKELMYKARAVN